MKNTLKKYFTDGSNDKRTAMLGQEHLSILLLLDTSSSMNGDKIKFLNNAVNVFIEDTMKDETAAIRVDLKIVQFNSEVSDVLDWTPVSKCEPNVNLTASGLTSMGAALNYGFDQLLSRKDTYHQLGVPCHHRQILLLVSDGEPTDDVTSAVSRVAKLEQENGLQVWALAIPGSNELQLKQWFERTLVSKTADTSKFFRWFSEGMIKLSKSRPGETPQYGRFPEGITFLDKIPDKYC